MDSNEEKVLNALEEVRAFRRADNYQEAWQQLQLAISLCPNDKHSLMGRLQAMQGQLHRDQGRMEEAINHYQRALDRFRQDKDLLKVAHTLRHLAEMEQESGHMNAARDYFDECKDLYESHSEVSQMDLANFYRAYALYLEKNEQEQAEVSKLWKMARDIYAHFGIAEGVQECDDHLGN